MWSSSSMYLFCILSLSLIILTFPVDVGNFSNHVKYCVLSLQWATINTSPVGFPYNWYQSIWFKVVFDFCSKMKVVKIIFWPYHRVEEEEMSTDTTKRLMSSPKCRSVEVINNPARPGSNHKQVNCINYK